MKKKLTAAYVKALPTPDAGEIFVWDEELSCFGIKLTPTRKSYIVQCRIDGRTVKHALGKVGELTLHEARTKAMKSLAELRSGNNLNERKVKAKTQKVTLLKAFTDFKASRKLRPRTLQTYDESINRCLSDWLDKPVAAISPDMVEARHKALSNKNGPRGKGEATANQAMTLLRAVLNFAGSKYQTESGGSLLPVNPVNRLTQIRAWNRVARRQDVISPHQMKAWYRTVIGIDNRDLSDYFLLCLFTGLRRSEALNLKWSYVSFRSKTLTLPAAITKTHSTFQIPLTAFLVELLASRAKIRRLDNDYIFPGKMDGSHIVEPKRAIAKVNQLSGVQWSMHTLRRTFETTAESLDIPYYALKRLLNHSISGDVTSGYIVTNAERLREPMEKISQFFIREMEIQLSGATAVIVETLA